MSLTIVCRRPIYSVSVLLAVLIFVGMSSPIENAARAAEPTTDRPINFSRDIRPILADRCFACHGPDRAKQENELRLDVRAEAIKDAITPGKAKDSELLARITSSDEDEMMPPPDSNKPPLSAEQVALVRRWIDAGAKYDAHWAFVQPVRPALPKVKDAKWPLGPIDRFIAAQHDRRGLKPSPAADRITLVRRLSFDLRGLPPSRGEVDAFLADKNDDAYEKLVDRLLRSPHYGERMAMYWLDLVRYADSCGYHSDVTQSISPYRDYVIDAFNNNMRFDRFTREQLAGDLLPDPTLAQRVASGYNRLNKTTEEGGAQPGEYTVKSAADRVRTTAGTWLGATMGCAECHDHKYDPYTTKDFYSMVAIFADVQERGVYGGGRRDPELMVPNREQVAWIKAIDAQASKLQRSLDSSDTKLSDAERKIVQQQIAKFAAERKAIEKRFTRTMITVSAKPRVIRILPRGNWLDQSGKVVSPAVPEFLPQPKINGKRLTRLDFADWIVSRDNPLTARVFVNRLWKMYFGTGLSKRLDDVGTQGEWPTHPELLDWLAVHFRDGNQSFKDLHRLIVTSAVCRQSSASNQRIGKLDGGNRYLWRMNRRRLEAESLRDSVLAVSGKLNLTMYGPGFNLFHFEDDHSPRYKYEEPHPDTP
ncbi:MAG: PSD1 domain-containing protein, partial [Planctomycetes bacterium]|nr:PSD1 domain-containing protein [Planctomycetota bacterium]